METGAGRRIAYDVMSAAVTSDRGPLDLPQVEPVSLELELAQAVTGFREFAARSNLWDIAVALTARSSGGLLHNCEGTQWSTPVPEVVDAAKPIISTDDLAAMWLLPWRADRPLGELSVKGLSPVNIRAGPNLAMYRIPDGEAIRSICGSPPLPTPLLAADIAAPGNDAPAEYLQLASALNGPTVAVVVASEWEEEGVVLGVVSVWSSSNDDWQLIAMRVFGLAEESR